MAPVAYFPTSNQLVDMALVTGVVDGRITSINVWLRSLITLTPTAIAYVEANNLVPEIISKAGISEQTTFLSKSEVSATTEGDKYLYQLQFIVDTGIA